VRGFKRCEAETREAYETGKFTDRKKRSFIGRRSDGTQHLLLAGEDKSRTRDEIFERDKGICTLCPVPHYVGKIHGEWDHVRHMPWERCDCPSNGRVACKRSHVNRHTVRKKEELPVCPGVRL
jgi:hypothetical protein